MTAGACSARSRSATSPPLSATRPASRVDKRTIVVGNPIKSLGSHSVSVKLHDDVAASVALNVIPG